jgi:hypothetical protein
MKLSGIRSTGLMGSQPSEKAQIILKLLLCEKIWKTSSLTQHDIL